MLRMVRQIMPDRLEGIIRCPACGTAGYPTDKYCACCGGHLTRICRDCGAEVTQPVANYCTQCGSALKAAEKSA
jgi:hypothetical protein